MCQNQLDVVDIWQAWSCLTASEILHGNRTSQSVIKLQYAKHQTGSQSRENIGDGTDPGEREVREGMQGKRPDEQAGVKNTGGALGNG